MSSEPYSRERRRASLKGFGHLATISGPLIVLVAIVMAFGLWPDSDDSEAPLGLTGTAPAGESLVVDEPNAIVVLWATPADVGPGEISCETRDGDLPVDGAPQEPGPAVQVDDEGAEWTRLVAAEGMQRSVTCTGSGLTAFGYVAATEVDQGQGAVFFGIAGVIITLLGLLARRWSRRADQVRPLLP